MLELLALTALVVRGGDSGWPLRDDSPEVPLIVGDSIRWAVQRWRLQNNYLHLLRSVATETGYQALPDAGGAHVNVGEEDLAGGGNQKCKRVCTRCWTGLILGLQLNVLLGLVCL